MLCNWTTNFCYRKIPSFGIASVNSDQSLLRNCLSISLHLLNALNTELNVLREIICLRKEVSVKNKQFLMSLKIGGTWHTLSAMLLYK